MADWLNIAGGAGKGYVQGQEDLQRKAEFDAMQRQRLRVEKQQQMDDELQKTLKKVRTPGMYTDIDSSPEAGAEGPPSPTAQASRPITKTTVSEADYNRALADAYGRSGRPEDVVRGATLRAAAYQSEAADRASRAAKAQEVLSEAGRLHSLGDYGNAARVLQQGYAQHPDGHDIVIENLNGVPHMGVATGGRYIAPPQPVTKESVGSMINQGYAMLNTDSHFKAQELGIHQQTADATTMQAKAAQQHAATEAQKVYWETLGDGGSMELAKKRSEEAYNYAHANYMNNRTSLDRQANKFGPSQQFVDDATGQTVFATPVRGKDGTVSWQREIMPQGLRPMKQPAQWDDEQKLYAGKLATMEEQGTGVYAPNKDGKIDQSKIAAYKKEHRLDRPGSASASPFAQSLIESGDPDAKKGGDKAAPAPAPKAKSGTDLVPPQYRGSQANKTVNPEYAAFVAKYGLPPTPTVGSRGSSRVNPDYTAWLERVNRAQQ